MFYEVCAWDCIEMLCFTMSALGTVSKRDVLQQELLRNHSNAVLYLTTYSEQIQITVYT